MGDYIGDYYRRGSNTAAARIAKAPSTLLMARLGNWVRLIHYDDSFLMEMDAVPIKHHWLEQFEMEAAGMTPGSLAVRGRQYMVDEWDLLEHMMPEYSMEHINGNAVYNLEPNWTKYLRETFMSDANNDMMEKMAFDVEFAMIAIDAMNETTCSMLARWPPWATT